VAVINQHVPSADAVQSAAPRVELNAGLARQSLDYLLDRKPVGAGGGDGRQCNLITNTG
jgi:hypothetical protein